MRSTILQTSLVALLVTASSVTVMADERGEIIEKAKALKREAAELSEKGHKEEAENLARQSRELMEKAELLKGGRRDPDAQHKSESARQNPDIQHLKERLADLITAQNKAKESGAEQEAKEIAEQIEHLERTLMLGQFEKLRMVPRRIQHVRVAAENLKAAEMHDMAHELMKKAEAMEKEMHVAKVELARTIKTGDHERGPEPKGEARELRSENERLRRELNELREVVKKLQIKLESESPADLKDDFSPPK